MIATIVRWALAAAIVFGVLYAIVAGYELWRDGKVAEGDRAGAGRVQAQWDTDKRARDAATLKAVAEARATEQEISRLAALGERHARQRDEQRAAADLAAARGAADAAGGLRGDIAALDASARAIGLPEAAACPGQFAAQRDAAIRARAALGACSAEYTRLAADADGAERALALRLDTALSYIIALRPP